ncbi:ABC transporter substrate-binding protein [Stappia indica]|uniref:ABC transporter substrate-binding protein n=1 Tax=Stappia indica TaxID=538381 RepID=UPI001CD54F94|nr:ABC transporter substrate-binding protein [Stappia indica]MCA1297018.1 ABC transporter substrate-binding protein [Stappia indica]
MSTNNSSTGLHSKVPQLRKQMKDGALSRREFVRFAALLGVGAGAAYSMAGLPSPAFADDQANMPFPPDDPNAQSGGVLKVAMQVQKMEDPATYSWVEMSNQTRHILEHLTMTGPDNVTRPMLAERWEASDDLKTWTFYLRKGVKWNNGDDFTTEDVKFNFERWMNPDLGSSNVGLSSIAALMEEKDGKKVMRDGAIEVIDDHTIRFHLSKAVLSFPEDMYNYPTALVHRSFKPPFSDNAIGTGPFTLVENTVGDRCILKRVEGIEYWGGKVYLDEIHYYNFDEDNQLTTFAGGDVDAIYEFGVEQMELAKALDGNIIAARTAQTLCCRFQVTEKPFDDKRVRQAIVKAVDNALIKELVYPEGGDIGENQHVAPIHPEYFKLPPLVRDVDGAKALLAEAGYPDGLELTIDVGNTDGPWHQTVAEAMRDQLKDAGITLNVNVMPPSKYWEIWDKTPFGATAWTHRPLGTMVLSLGYRTGVPWNETKYSNPEWDKALDEAEATLDVEKRRALMENIEKVLQDDAVMVQPICRPVYTIASKAVHGYPAHPTQYHQFNKVWKAA